MKGTTRIVIQNPAGTDSFTFQTFKSCNVTSAIGGRASSFSFVVEAFDSNLIDRFPKGSDVKIYQTIDGQPEQQTIRGWLNVPGKQREGLFRIIEFSGVDYTGRLQSIIITESYDGQTIDAIVRDLLAKYVPWATTVNVQAATQAIKKKFNREYLFEALEFLAGVEGWEFYIDFNLDLNFYDPQSRINPTTLSESKGNYNKGSAKFSEDSRLINKLYVRGGSDLSTPNTQRFNGDGVKRTFQLDYKPHNLSLTKNDVAVDPFTIGIDNVDTGKAWYTNYQEKLLRQDTGQTVLGTSDHIDVTYQYEYPILLLLEDKISQAKYGVFEDKLDVNSDDKDLVKTKGLLHLKKYSIPLQKGSIEPFEGYYRAGELVPLEISSLNISGTRKISQVTYNSQPGEVKISLEMETDYDTRLVLKEIRNAIKRLEQQFEEDAPVEQILGLLDSLIITDLVSVRANDAITDILAITDNPLCTTTVPGAFTVGTARVGLCRV